jgi:hypothetical protein
LTGLTAPNSTKINRRDKACLVPSVNLDFRFPVWFEPLGFKRFPILDSKQPINWFLILIIRKTKFPISLLLLPISFVTLQLTRLPKASLIVDSQPFTISFLLVGLILPILISSILPRNRIGNKIIFNNFLFSFGITLLIGAGLSWSNIQYATNGQILPAYNIGLDESKTLVSFKIRKDTVIERVYGQITYPKEISVQETTGLLWGTWFKFVAITKDADITNKPPIQTEIFSN